MEVPNSDSSLLVGILALRSVACSIISGVVVGADGDDKYDGTVVAEK